MEGEKLVLTLYIYIYSSISYVNHVLSYKKSPTQHMVDCPNGDKRLYQSHLSLSTMCYFRAMNDLIVY